MWRAWCSGVRRSCCGASARARSTATHTTLGHGYDAHCLDCPPLTGLIVPHRSPCQALGAARSVYLLVWTERTVLWECPWTLLLATRWPLLWG